MAILFLFVLTLTSVTALITPLTDENGEVDVNSLTNHVYLLEQLFNTMSTKYDGKMADLQTQVDTLNSVIQSSNTELQSVQAIIQHTNNQIANLTAALGRLKTAVSFEVTLTSGFFSVPDNTTLQFNNIIINEGNGYSNDTGVFTAPISGTYLFWLHVNNAVGNEVIDLHVMKEGVYVIRAHSPAGILWGIASATALFHLTQGEEVWIQKVTGSDSIYGHGLSSYGGVLITED